MSGLRLGLFIAALIIGGFFGLKEAYKEAYFLYQRHNLQHATMDRNMVILQRWGDRMEKRLQALEQQRGR